LIREDKIEKISFSSFPTDQTLGVRVIDGGDRTLMPGLIDAHWHAFVAAAPMTDALSADLGYLNLLAGRQASETLMRGFTSVRDMAGPVFGLKRAIDCGVIAGPRIWPSGAMISQTSGHGDFRMTYELPRAPAAPLSQEDMWRNGAIADGQAEVHLRTREQLMLGASQIKLAAGGGVISDHDPIDVAQYTEGELNAAVEDAENWGTYVTVHAYTPRAIQMAIRAGVKCIEHGHLIDEATAELIAKKGIWLSLQPFVDEDDAIAAPEGSLIRFKQLQVFKGTDTAYALAKKYKIKTAWGTDILFNANQAERQGAKLAKLRRWYTPAETLIMATSTNAELLALSGPRNPYPGKLGVIEEGALADLLLVDGDPLENLKLIEDPAKNFVVIMKDGKIYKNTLTK
jgi:imidazolonepropionase-like amidohydrolase